MQSAELALDSSGEKTLTPNYSLPTAELLEHQPEALQGCWRTEIFPLCHQLDKARRGQSRSLLYLGKLSDLS